MDATCYTILTSIVSDTTTSVGYRFEDCLTAGGVVVMEWGDKFPSVLPASRLDIRFDIVSADQRRIEWTSADESHRHYQDVDMQAL